MGGVSVVAHRNASGDFPENTAVAFQEAIDLGVEMIEFDVQLTADRCLVICHDPSVDRTSDGAGRIGEMCMAEIEELDAGSWFSARYAGERFATLSETLDMMPGGMRLNVHIKASDESRDALVRLVVDELVRRNLTASAFATGNEATTMAVRSIAPHLEICTNLPVARCLEIGCRILQPANSITTTDLVTEAHHHGLEVNPFFADEADEIRRLIECGVDGILTNHPRKMLDLLRSC